MEVFIVGVVALIAGFALGAKLYAKAVAPEINEVSATQAIDRANYLQTLRRELANILIWRDPQRYLQLYRELQSEAVSFRSWRPEEVRNGCWGCTKSIRTTLTSTSSAHASTCCTRMASRGMTI